MWMALIQLIEDLSRTKRLSKREPLQPDGLSCDVTFISSSIGLGLKHQLFLGLEPASSLSRPHPISSSTSQGCGLRLELPIGSPGSPADQAQVLGLFRLHNLMSPFLRTNHYRSLLG